jgi:hypothetical protein
MHDVVRGIRKSGSTADNGGVSRKVSVKNPDPR